MGIISGNNYIIAGGSSGIGLALTEKLLASDANVWVMSRTCPQTLIDAGAKHINIDFSTINELATADLPDTIHGAAYCPGNINLKPFNRLKPDEFEKDFRLNVVGAVVFLQGLHKHLKKADQASVVLFSTVASKLGMSFHASTASSKSAVEGLGKSLAAEWASQKIRVNVVAPSLTDTPLANALLSTDDKKDASNKRHPIGRYGTSNDVADLAFFLLGQESTWITGQIIGVDGGMGSLK